MSREYPCVYYDSGKCRKFEEPGYVDYCVLGPCSHETPSNADRIRAMSDEELARLLAVLAKADCMNTSVNDCGECPFSVFCSDCVKGEELAWLQQPAEEVDHE